MKPDLQIGTTASGEVDVTLDMRPAFNGTVVHDVCSTWDLVRHMETAARAVLAPNLEPHEEGIGSQVSIDHVAPAPVGCTLHVEARAEALSDSTLVCAIEVRTGETVVATGTQTQRIFPRDVIDDIMRRAKTSSESSDQ